MNMITCPWCGSRDTSEFAYAGEGNPRPDPATASPEAWRHYLYVRRNPDGWTTELWRHRVGCGTYLRLERHRTTDEVRLARAVGGDPA
jgi:heterotetrameric sarcosine oxidase delta subunit